MSVVVTKHSQEIKYRIECKGLARDEFFDIYEALREAYPASRPVIRNPSPLHFDAQSAHAILIHLPLAAIGLYAVKKAIDKGAEILGQLVMERLKPSDQTKKKLVTIYDERNRPIVEVEVKATKRK